MQPLENVNFKVEPSLKKRMWKEATKITGRTISKWLRDLVEKELGKK
jgi:hypothetical protein